MSWVSGIVVFLIIWWVVIFAVLPWGVRIPDQAEPGHATSAPEQPRLWMKVLVTTGITIVLWLIADVIISSDILTFREPR